MQDKYEAEGDRIRRKLEAMWVVLGCIAVIIIALIACALKVVL